MVENVFAFSECGALNLWEPIQPYCLNSSKSGHDRYHVCQFADTNFSCTVPPMSGSQGGDWVTKCLLSDPTHNRSHQRWVFLDSQLHYNWIHKKRRKVCSIVKHTKTSLKSNIIKLTIIKKKSKPAFRYVTAQKQRPLHNCSRDSTSTRTSIATLPFKNLELFGQSALWHNGGHFEN